MEFGNLSGFDIYESMHLPEFITRPNRIHVVKDSMTVSYHKRIQKKWNKRFGFKTERQIIRNGNKLFAHPNTVKIIKDGIINK